MVFRTGVKPVPGLFRLLGVVVVLDSVTSTPSDVNPLGRNSFISMVWCGSLFTGNYGCRECVSEFRGVVFASSGVFG
jgi:hypothetical protein